MLVAARAVQGIGGAIASAVSLSLIVILFTEPAERAKAMGVFGLRRFGRRHRSASCSAACSPASLDWHWIFLVNVPIGIAVCAAVSSAAAGEPRTSAAGGRLDVAGAVIVTAALMLAVYAIVNGNQDGWLSAETLGLLRPRRAPGRVLRLIESRVGSPLMPLGLFGSRNVAIANVVGVLWAAAMFAWFFLSALYLQLVLGLQPAAGRSRVPAREPDHGPRSRSGSRRSS